MKLAHVEYLKSLEEISLKSDPAFYYLWPRTPIGNDHQDKILQRVGISDYEVHNQHSRSSKIVRQINALIKHRLLREDFSILDIACGDAIILWQIKKIFPKSHCYGIDCNKDKFSTHSMVQSSGVQLFHVFIQHLFSDLTETPFDLALMLNTYRGWDSAELRDNERNLPDLADAWFEKNTRYVILTATSSQTARLLAMNFKIKQLGKGEDDSEMICLSKNLLPNMFWREILSFKFREKPRWFR
jgi:hypothetical protein